MSEPKQKRNKPNRRQTKKENDERPLLSDRTPESPLVYSYVYRLSITRKQDRLGPVFVVNLKESILFHRNFDSEIDINYVVVVVKSFRRSYTELRN